MRDLAWSAEMRGMSADQAKLRIRDVGVRCGLSDVAGKEVRELSKGYRQRVGLAQAMLHDPDILLLDEPPSGLAPYQIVEIRSLIKELGQEKTVILSTHILPEVQATCSRILIISGGKLVADATPAALRAREKGSRYRLVVETNGTAQEAIREKLAGVAGVAHCDAAASEAGAMSFVLDSTGDTDLRRSLFRAAVDNRWPLLELVRESVSLEDVFRNLTTRDVAKDAGASAPRREEARS